MPQDQEQMKMGDREGESRSMAARAMMEKMQDKVAGAEVIGVTFMLKAQAHNAAMADRQRMMDEAYDEDEAAGPEPPSPSLSPEDDELWDEEEAPPPPPPRRRR